MSNNALAVTVGKPKIGGAVFRAPIGTTLPTDATTALAAAFEGMGYVSDDGVTNGNDMTIENINAWGGDNVLNVLTEKRDTWKMVLIEAMNTEVLKTAYGDTNVSGTLATGIAVTVNNKPQGAHSYVIDMIYNNNAVKRVVIPYATVTELAEIVYADGEAVGYDVTLSCTPDASGNTHYEYIKTVS